MRSTKLEMPTISTNEANVALGQIALLCYAHNVHPTHARTHTRTRTPHNVVFGERYNADPLLENERGDSIFELVLERPVALDVVAVLRKISQVYSFASLCLTSPPHTSDMQMTPYSRWMTRLHLTHQRR
jgi:hypothetical protein